jgi:muscarinic acetylcholine receptor
VGKKTSHDGTKNDKTKTKSKTKNEQTTGGDKSERSSSPAFDSDEDSTGNANQQVQLLAPIIAAKKRAPSIAGLLVIIK